MIGALKIAVFFSSFARLGALSLFAVLLMLGVDACASAGNLIDSFTDAGQGPRTDISGPPGGGSAIQSLGYSFTYTGLESAQVSTLGVYDGNAGPLIDSHLVSLYSSTGTLLTSTTVPAGTGVSGAFDYASTAAYTLQPGATYVLVAEFASNGTPNAEFYPTNLGTNDVFHDASSVTGSLPGGDFTSLYSSTFVGGFPDSVGPFAGYIGPSLQASHVPEPASILLLGMGGVALCLAARTRRRKRDDRVVQGMLALVAVLMTVNSSQAALIDYWPLNEGSGAVAHDTVGGLNGTLLNNAHFVAGGPTGGAVSLTSATNDLIDMGNVLPLNAGDFSIVAWIDTTSTFALSVVGKQNTGVVSSYILGLGLPSGGNGTATFYQSEGSPGNYLYSTGQQNDGNWHQLVATYQAGGVASLYVDGQLQASRPANPIVPSSADFMIGGLTTGGQPTGYYNCLIDGVRIYDNALSAPQVLALYNSVPEPASVVLLGLGVIGFCLVTIRVRRKKATKRAYGSISFKRLATLLLVLALGTVKIAAAATVYDFETDFSNTTNAASSVWSYLYAAGTTRNDNYTLLPNVNDGGNGLPSGAFMWQIGSAPVPAVGLNETGGTIDAGTLSWPAGESYVHPGNLYDTVVRWTAPAAGSYDVAFSYADLDPHGGDGIKWYVDQNTTDLASGVYSDGGASGLQLLTHITVAAGDHINFIVDPNANYDFDATALYAHITAVPEPASVVLLGLGAIGVCLAARMRAT